MISTTASASPQINQLHKQVYQRNISRLKQRKRNTVDQNYRIKKHYQHLLVSATITILYILCTLPEFIAALKDVSVTIPQAVKRGSNAMLSCNYDMENDTLYSVKWYKGRREFYRYTPKENPAMKVFPSQSGINVDCNLSNQSHVVLLAVPLNISGKFTCEISVEAPSFQTAMVSGEMEVVDLPEEPATVSGIQPRYRIGDLVDGYCSIKYSKPAANLTWTINGVVVPPHHIKTYQIEKYEENNLESVMSDVHFMVTTQHFLKGQMRLKCTASIFNIFKEEIESIIEEDRPRIMASGQSYPPDHGYGAYSNSEDYERNKSYLTYLTAPKSSASPSADFAAGRIAKQKFFKGMQLFLSLMTRYIQYGLPTTLANKMKTTFEQNNLNNVVRLMPKKFRTSLLLIFFVVFLRHIKPLKLLTKILKHKMSQKVRLFFNVSNVARRIAGNRETPFSLVSLWHKTQYRHGKEKQRVRRNHYQEANKSDSGKQPQHQHDKHCLVSNQIAVNEIYISNATNNNTKTQIYTCHWLPNPHVTSS